jgi:hypothetical protein
MEICPSLIFLDGLPVTPEDRLDGSLIENIPGPRRRSTQEQHALARKQALKMPSVNFDEIVFEEGDDGTSCWQYSNLYVSNKYLQNLSLLCTV